MQLCKCNSLQFYLSQNGSSHSVCQLSLSCSQSVHMHRAKQKDSIASRKGVNNRHPPMAHACCMKPYNRIYYHLLAVRYANLIQCTELSLKKTSTHQPIRRHSGPNQLVIKTGTTSLYKDEQTPCTSVQTWHHGCTSTAVFSKE